MGVITNLRVTQVRNIRQAEIECNARCNVFDGQNGSGKTSLLETVHWLAHGKSFRTGHTDSLINAESAEAVVFAQLIDGHRIGVSRGRRTGQTLKLDQVVQAGWERVAQVLPVLVIDSRAFHLIEGGPGARRQFIDWGVFHVEPRFVSEWRRTKKCLAHRNHLLKLNEWDSDQLMTWETELARAADFVDAARATYISELLPLFNEVFSSLALNAPFDLGITYQRGWSSDQSLLDVLKNNRRNDARYGATQLGPQRADIIIKADGRKAVEVLSRGQQKLLVSALKIAQGRLMAESNGSNTVFLVDDLPAELDSTNRGRVLRALGEIGCQLFLTCVDLSALSDEGLLDQEYAAFHVEHGKISAHL